MSISESPIASQLFDTDTEDVSIESVASPGSEQLNPDESHPDPLYTAAGPCLTDPKDFDKIYDGSALSVCAFNCYVMKFAIKHCLTYKAIDDLLDLLNFLCPKPNRMPSSIYKLQRFFKQHESQTSNKLYCTKCDKLYDDCDCGKPDSANIGHLVNISIDKPLQAVLSGNNH